MIETERLKLIPCSRAHYEAALRNEQELAKLLGVSLAENWTQFPETMPVGYAMLKAKPENLLWGMYFFIHKNDNSLIGNGGFKGFIDENGMVEIGYALAPVYWNKGLATEAAKGMIDYAFSNANVKMVDAHTLAAVNASVRVLQKCGMTKIGEKFDTEDGDIWHWRILREEYQEKKAIGSRRKA